MKFKDFFDIPTKLRELLIKIYEIESHQEFIINELAEIKAALNRIEQHSPPKVQRLTDQELYEREQREKKKREEDIMYLYRE